MRLLCNLAACGVVLASVACNAAPGLPTAGSGQLLAAFPDHVRQGDTITLSGQNWQPNSPVMLAINVLGNRDATATNLGTTKADAQGQFTFVSVVPQAAAPGVQTIVAHGDLNQIATASFTVLGGGGITEGNAQTLISRSTTSEITSPTGTAVPLPSVPTSTPERATNTPQPNVSAKAVWHGDKLELSGSGWPVNAQIIVSVSQNKDGKGAVALGILGTNAQGQFDVVVKVPKDVHANWYIVLHDAIHTLITPIVKNAD